MGVWEWGWVEGAETIGCPSFEDFCMLCDMPSAGALALSSPVSSSTTGTLTRRTTQHRLLTLTVRRVGVNVSVTSSQHAAAHPEIPLDARHYTSERKRRLAALLEIPKVHGLVFQADDLAEEYTEGVYPRPTVVRYLG